MTTRCRVLAMTALLVLGGGAVARAQQRVQPRAVEIQPQQLPQPEKVAVRVRPHAELGVAHVAHYPAPATEGQSIAIEIKVENEGTAPSSGNEVLHFDCENTQSGGPACPFGAGQRSVPVIHSLKEPYPTGPYAHSEQLLTTPTWKPGSYEVKAWIAEPGATVQPEVFIATIEVKPKSVIKLGQAYSAILPSETPGLPDLVVIVEGPKFRVKNQGGTASPMVPYRWSCSTYGTVPLGPCSWWGDNGSSWDFLPGLDPGEEWVRTLKSSTVNMAPCPADDNPFIVMCKFTLAVDPANSLTEIADTNNTGSYNVPAD